MFGDAGLSDIEIRITADLARLRQDMAAANSLVDRGLQSMRSAADSIKGAFSGLLGGLSVAAFSGWVKGAIDAADALDEMSQRVGVSAEELSRLQVAYQMAGLQSDAMQSSLSKLSKGIAEGGGAFDTLGVKTRNADGTLRGATAVLGDLADEFATIKDGTAKTALAMELFGKSGAEMVPLLNGGSEGLRKMAKLAEDLGVALDKETGARAGEFNDTLDALGLATKGAATQIASQLLPSLQVVAGAMLESAKGASILTGAGEVLSSTLKGLYYFGTGVGEVFKTVGTVLGVTVAQLMTSFSGLGEMIQALLTGDLKGAEEAFRRTQREFSSIQEESRQDQEARWAETGQRISDVWNNVSGTTGAMAAGLVKQQRELALQSEKDKKAMAEAAAEAKKLRDERERLAKAGQQYLQGLEDQGAALRQQLALGRELTASEKALLELDRQIREGKIARGSAQERLARAEIASIQSMQDGIALRKELAKAEADLGKLTAQSLADRQKETATLQEQVAKQREHNAAIGATKEQLLALEQARIDDAIATKQQQAAALDAVGYYPEERAEIEKQIAALRELRDLKGESATRTVAVEAAQEAQKAWEATAQSIGQGLTDSLFRAFEAGKGFWKTLWDGIVNTVKTTVLKVVISGQDGKSGIVGSIMNLLGLGSGSASTSGSAAGSSPTGGLLSGGPLQILSSGRSLLGLLAAGAGGSIAAGSALGLANTFALGSQLATSGGSLMGLQTAGQLFGAGQYSAAAGMSAGVIAPWAVGLGIGHMGGRAISNGYAALGGSGNSAVNLGTIAGAFFGGPIGAALGGAIGGLVNRAFGMRAREYGASGIEGTFGGGDFTGEAWADWKQKGGWFRSDKSGTDRSAVDAELASGLDKAAAGVLEQAKRYGQVLGLPVQSLADVQAQFRIQLGQDEKANQEAIAKALGDYSSALLGTFSTQLAPVQREGETAAQTMERLSASLIGANDALAGLNVIMFNTSVAGADAASKLVDLFGGLESLGTASAGYYSRYYSEGERAALATQQMTDALAQVGLKLPENEAALRAMVEAQDLMSEGGRQAFKVLMDVEETFYAVAASGRAAAQERAGLERQLLELQGDTAALRRLELEALDPSNRALQELIWSLQDAGKAAEQTANAMVTLADGSQLSMKAFGARAGEVTDAQLRAAFGIPDGLASGSAAGMSPAALSALTQSQLNYAVGSSAWMGAAANSLVMGGQSYADFIATKNASNEAGALGSNASYLSQAVEETRKLRESMDNLADVLGKSIEDTRQSELSILSPEQKYAEAKAAFDSISRQALAGDQAAAEQLVSARALLLKNSKSFNASTDAYGADFSASEEILRKVLAQLEKLNGTTAAGVRVTANGLADVEEASREASRQSTALIDRARLAAQQGVA